MYYSSSIFMVLNRIQELVKCQSPDFHRNIVGIFNTLLKYIIFS